MTILKMLKNKLHEQIVEVEEQPKSIITELFDKPTEEMRTYLRPLHIKTVVEGKKEQLLIFCQ